MYTVAGRALLVGLGDTETDAMSIMASDVKDKNDVSFDTNKSVNCLMALRSSSVKVIMTDRPLMLGLEPDVRV